MLFRSFSLIGYHIREYWDKKYGPDNTPIQNITSVDEFLIAFSHQTTIMVSQVEREIGENAQINIKKIYLNILETLKTQMKILSDSPLGVSQDDSLKSLFQTLREDIEGTNLHLTIMLESKSLNHMIDPEILRLVYALGGRVITPFVQIFHPFHGAVKESETGELVLHGNCSGVVQAWAHNRSLNSSYILQRQNEGPRDKKIKMHGCNTSQLRISLGNVGNFRTIAQYHYFHLYSLGMLIKNHDQHLTHLIGFKQCYGISEYEICDHQHGIFRFPDYDASVTFLEFIFAKYYLLFGYDMVDLMQAKLDHMINPFYLDRKLCHIPLNGAINPGNIGKSRFAEEIALLRDLLILCAQHFHGENYRLKYTIEYIVAYILVITKIIKNVNDRHIREIIKEIEMGNTRIVFIYLSIILLKNLYKNTDIYENLLEKIRMQATIKSSEREKVRQFVSNNLILDNADNHDYMSDEVNHFEDFILLEYLLYSSIRERVSSEEITSFKNLIVTYSKTPILIKAFQNISYYNAASRGKILAALKIIDKTYLLNLGIKAQAEGIEPAFLLSDILKILPQEKDIEKDKAAKTIYYWYQRTCAENKVLAKITDRKSSPLAKSIMSRRVMV